MKGYFSQLARATGLSFASGKISPERGLSPAPALSALRERVPTPEPLHVEEVTFTSSSPTTGAAHEEDMVAAGQATITDSLASSLPGSRRFNHESAETFSDAGGIGSSGGPTQRASPAVAESSAVSIDEVQISSSEPATTRRQGNSTQGSVLGSDRDLVRLAVTPPLAVEHHRNESPERVETIELGQESLSYQTAAGPPQPLERESEISGSPADDLAVGNAILQDYLREVSAWIAAKPETLDADLNRQQGLEARNEDSRRDFSLERETNPATPPLPPRMREPELQDLSLSIGTISIVIEEPNQQAAIPPSPQPVAPNVTQERGREPTSLSRYYLRG